MSVTLMGLVWQLPDSFNCQQTMVLLKLADHANDEGGSIFPSKETLAKKCKLDVRTVRKHMKYFESIDLLVLVLERVGMPSIYRIDVPVLKSLIEPEPDYSTPGNYVPPAKVSGVHQHPPTPGKSEVGPPTPAPAKSSSNHHKPSSSNGTVRASAKTPEKKAAPKKEPKPKVEKPKPVRDLKFIEHYPKILVKDGWFEIPAPYCEDPDIMASVKDWVMERMNSKKPLTIRAMQVSTRWWSKYPLAAVAHAADCTAEKHYVGIIEDIAKQFKAPDAPVKSIEQIAQGSIMSMEERQRKIREAALSVAGGTQLTLGTGTES